MLVWKGCLQFCSKRQKIITFNMQKSNIKTQKQCLVSLNLVLPIKLQNKMPLVERAFVCQKVIIFNTENGCWGTQRQCLYLSNRVPSPSGVSHQFAGNAKKIWYRSETRCSVEIRYEWRERQQPTLVGHYGNLILLCCWYDAKNGTRGTSHRTIIACLQTWEPFESTMAGGFVLLSITSSTSSWYKWY